jgi:hypothetical protein
MVAWLLSTTIVMIRLGCGNTSDDSRLVLIAARK